MSRRHAAEKRKVLPDPKFKDLVLAKFTNALMRDGKKSAAERIVYGAFDVMEKKAGQDPLRMFHEAIENVKPTVEVRSRRVGGATYQVPVEVRADRRQALAIRWLVDTARNRSENTMVDRLSSELMDAANNRGAAVKRGRTPTAWQRPTRPSRITAGRSRRTPNGTTNPYRSLSQHRHHGSHRCRQDDDDRAHPLLHWPVP